MELRLEREKRGSIPHFKGGQTRAFTWPDAPDVAMLVFVSMLGWAVRAKCYREDGEWKCASLVMNTATGIQTPERIPNDTDHPFKFTDSMLAALNEPTVLADNEQLRVG